MDLLWLILGLLAIAAVVFRKHITVQFPFFLIKNLGLARWIFRTTRNWRLKRLADAGVLVGFLAMAAVVYLIGAGALNGLATGGESQVKIVLPGARTETSPLVQWIQWDYLLIAIGVILIVHEFSHAAVAAVHGLKSKSVVLGTLLVVPVAGVELDDKKVNKAPLWTRLRIFAAGSFANFLTVAVVSVLIIGLAFSAAKPIGLKVLKVENGTPAEGLLVEGTTIVEVNGAPALTFGDVVVSAMRLPLRIGAFSRLKAGETVTLETTNGTVELTTTSFPDGRARIGVISQPQVTFQKPFPGFFWLFGLLGVVAALNLGIGIFNMFPLPFTDGGQMVAHIIREVLPSRAALLIGAGYTLMLGLLALNLAGPWLRKILIP